MDDARRLEHLVPMDAPARALKKRARHRRRALKPSRGNVARQSAEVPAIGATKKSVTLYLPADRWRELKILATVLDTTMDALMRRGVDLVLAEDKGKPAERRVGGSSGTGPHPAAARPTLSRKRARGSA
jgi:hypothetical protein